MEKILIAEDEEKLRDLFAQFLKAKGYQVVEARDGQEALALATRQPFDLIMMDVKMPRMDGLSALQQIRTISPAAGVILITGYRVTPELEEALQEGTVEYLRKPFTFDQLMETIQRIRNHEHNGEHGSDDESIAAS